MSNFLKKAGLGVAMVATAMSVAAPADAQRYGYRHHNRGGNAAGAAIVGGIIGLGIGAAIASNNNNRYYDRGYYNNGYYNNGYAQYDRGYYPRNGYYNYNYRPRRCWIERRFDPYYGRGVPVRVCG